MTKVKIHWIVSGRLTAAVVAVKLSKEAKDYYCQSRFNFKGVAIRNGVDKESLLIGCREALRHAIVDLRERDRELIWKIALDQFRRGEGIEVTE